MGEHDDPFSVLRMLLYINIDSKITNVLTVLLVIIYTLEHCLEINYMITNFNLNLLIRYGPVTTFSLLMTVGALIPVALGKEIFEVVAFHRNTCWPLNMIREDAQTKLKRQCYVVNGCLFVIVLLLLSTLIIYLPFFGNQRELLLCIQVFEKYFGKWSFIPYYFYFVGFAFLYYQFFRISFGFVYIFLETQLQYFLIEEYLFETYHIDNLKHWKYLQDTQYQEEIGKSLRLCIAHHNDLKKLVKTSVKLTITAMPVFLLLGVFLYISSFAHIINVTCLQKLENS
nr:PREDICTED: uncharacterized protein LOC107398987 [Tribolium castaneum]|eukprot:XP_015840088.1 PREDICTED: uncharacterized protein LOC107398987 [Tribolium castaneum]